MYSSLIPQLNIILSTSDFAFSLRSSPVWWTITIWTLIMDFIRLVTPIQMYLRTKLYSWCSLLNCMLWLQFMWWIQSIDWELIFNINFWIIRQTVCEDYYDRQFSISSVVNLWFILNQIVVVLYIVTNLILNAMMNIINS